MQPCIPQPKGSVERHTHKLYDLTLLRPDEMDQIMEKIPRNSDGY